MPEPKPESINRSKSGKGFGIALIVLFLIFLTGVYFAVFGWVVPKAASFAVPQKWRILPLRQPRSTVHNYLGEPVPGPGATKSESWSNGSKGKMYYLHIYYIYDSVAYAYSIHYQYKNWFGSRDYVLDSLSIR